MATESPRYITYVEAITLHIMLMRSMREERFGVFDRGLLESALSRSQQAVIYEGADLLRQAATLCFGLIKNHPWIGGNKRTAMLLVDRFLYRNGLKVRALTAETVEMVLAVEADRWGVDEVGAWYRQRSILISLLNY